MDQDSLLVLILDLSNYWSELGSTIDPIISQVLLLAHSHLALRQNNSLLIIGATSQKASILFPKPVVNHDKRPPTSFKQFFDLGVTY
jgi:Transcription factor Tfb4